VTIRSHRCQYRVGRDSITRSAAVVLLASGAWSGATLAGPGPEQSTTSASKRADGLAAWRQIYSVLTNPRCINCHTATNYPQPIRRVVGPADIAALAVHLMTNTAVTGATFDIDAASSSSRGEHP
jgi:mono/diheme cytochrome c family protein